MLRAYERHGHKVSAVIMKSDYANLVKGVAKARMRSRKDAHWSPEQSLALVVGSSMDGIWLCLWQAAAGVGLKAGAELGQLPEAEAHRVERLSALAEGLLLRYTAICMDSVGHQDIQEVAVPKKIKAKPSWQRAALQAVAKLRAESQLALVACEEGWWCAVCGLRAEAKVIKTFLKKPCNPQLRGAHGSHRMQAKAARLTCVLCGAYTSGKRVSSKLATGCRGAAKRH